MYSIPIPILSRLMGRIQDELSLHDGAQRRRLADGSEDLHSYNRADNSLNAAVTGASHGAELHVGDAHGAVGVHVAAVLSGKPFLEYWKRPWDRITENAILVEDRELVAPDRTGSRRHGRRVRYRGVRCRRVRCRRVRVCRQIRCRLFRWTGSRSRPARTGL